MKKNITFLLLFLIPFLFLNCKRRRECKGSPYSGEIVNEYSFDSKSSITIDRSQNYIINDTNSFRNFLINNYYLYNPINNPGDSIICNIDFSKFSLLGKYTSGACSDFYRNVSFDSENNNVIYSIKICDSRFCKKLISSQNWVVINKIPTNYSVEFQTKEY